MIVLCDYNEVFLEKSWSWLNDPEIKEKTNTPDFSKKQQLEWYKNIKSQKDYLVWGVMFDNNPIGVCGLKNISDNDCEYWGYIGEKRYWGKGIGSEIIQLMINKAVELNLNYVWLKVKEENIPALKLYEKFGFREFKKVGKLIYMHKRL